MYRNTHQHQHTCRICFEPKIMGQYFLSWFLYGEALCEACRKKMKGEWQVIEKLGLKINSLYPYEGFSRDALLRFKDGHDQWLNDVFLTPFLTRFYLKYFGSVVVCVPSHESVTDIRGYQPNVLVMKTQYLKICEDVLVKKHPYKQSTMHRDVRGNVKDVIVLENASLIKGKKVLLFDDLCTTGHSLRACYDLLKSHAHSIEVFALFHHEI